MQPWPSRPHHEAPPAGGPRRGRSGQLTVTAGDGRPQPELPRLWLPSITFLLYNCISPQPGASKPEQRPCQCGGEWTLDNLQTLFYDLSRGLELELVAKHLGKTRDQCRREVLHLRMVDRIPKLPCEEAPLALQGGSRWSACVQIRLCIELRDGCGLKQVAASLGRSMSSCKRQLRLLTDEGVNSSCTGCGRQRLYVVERSNSVVQGTDDADADQPRLVAKQQEADTEHASQASRDWPFQYATQNGGDNGHVYQQNNVFHTERR